MEFEPRFLTSFYLWIWSFLCGRIHQRAECRLSSDVSTVFSCSLILSTVRLLLGHILFSLVVTHGTKLEGYHLTLYVFQQECC